VLERRVVVRVHGVQGDPALRLDDGVVGERGVDVRRVEVGDAGPQGQVRRRGFLRLQGDEATHSLGDREALAPQQHLPGERGPVEPAGGELHVRIGPMVRA
jgi:hypothetical protein